MAIKNITNGQAPYYDDTESADLKNYYKLLFRPGYAPQSRELTQSQSLIHKQFKKLGDHFFKNGSVVIPGRISFDTRFNYVLLNIPVLHASRSLIEDSNWRKNNLLNGTIENANGLIAQIVNVSQTIDVSDNIKIFVKYSNADETTNVFGNNQLLTIKDSEGTTLFAANSKSSAATGVGSSATITNGVFYIRGLFVNVYEQTIILDDASNTPYYSVGLEIDEKIVNENDDVSLTDPAAGSSNYAAPGSHRLQINLNLVKKEFSQLPDSDNYIELLRLEAGEAVKLIDKTTYAILGDELARRTYDESGDYTVRPFLASIEKNDADNTKLKLAIEAGKAYVKGYEIETISKQYINDLNKARDFTLANNAIIRAPLGNYVLIKNITGIPNINEFASLNLKNSQGTIIGSASCRGLEFHGSEYDVIAGANSNIYKLFLFNVVTVTGQSFSRVYTIDGTGFTSTVFLSLTKLDGSVLGTNSTTLKGNSLVRWLSTPNQSLYAGDLIVVEQDTGTASTLLRVTANPSDNITLAVADITTYDYTKVVNKNFYDARASLLETDKNKLIFKLPYNYIKTIRGSGGVIDTNYNYRKYFEQVVGGSNIINVATGNANEEFISSSPADYVVTNTDEANVVLGISNISIGSNTVALTLTGTVAPGDNVKVIATIKKTQGSASQEKTKTLSTNQTYTYNIASPTGVNTGTTAQEFWIPKSDIFKITSIVSNSIDITSNYEFDNGQRDNYYDLGKLKLKPGYQIPTSNIVVTYDYFQHPGSGNYFSVDSYDVNLVETGKGYEYIPTYISTTDGEKYDLRDCLDFRPRINETRTGFTGTGSSTTAIMRSDVSADFEYYLNRIDKVYLDTAGQFHIIEGISALEPKTPEDPANGMVLYTIKLRAYTLSSDDVFLEFRENKRYTMRDIGKLETRISNLEYYTTLTLLEKETQDLEIIDESGLDRFKNGFIVDPFNGHGIGDVTNLDYKCSIDMESGEMRPIYNSKSISLKEVNTLDAQRTADFYQKTGDLLTLPYTEVSMIDQPIATSFLNVNPYSVFTFLGRLTLTPSMDTWKDTVQLPDLIINQDGNYDSMVATAEAYGTVWGEWQTHWFGKSTDVKVKSEKVGRGKNQPDRIHGSNWPIEIKTTTTTTTIKSGTSTRTGTQLTVVPKIVTTELDNKVVDISYIPYMRSIDVVFDAKGFKPNSRLYAFFDDVDVSTFVSAGTSFNAGATINSTPFITDETGAATGTFRIPNTNSIKFKTGKRKFTLTNSSINSQINSTTSGSSIFEATGLSETKRKSIISTRNAELVQEAIIENLAVTDTKVSTKSKTTWEDPIAQSFLCTESGGAFLSSIDLYFASKDANIPVIVSIREMNNGYPSQTILPFSEVVVNSGDVIINEFNDTNNQLTIKEDGESNIVVNNATSADFSKTRIHFNSPVYLQENSEYCFVIISNSNEYNLWIAKGRENKVGTLIPVQSQPYIGSLFKSQNASTWTAEQDSDIKFRLNKCSFNTGVSGVIEFVNDNIPLKKLEPNPFSYKYVSNGNVAQKVRVFHPNHGLMVGSNTTFSGATAFGPFSTGNLNATHVVTAAELDSYIIEITANSADNYPTPAADELLRGGGSVVYASENITYDSLYPNIRQIVLPNTTLDYEIKTTSAANPHDTVTTPYAVDSAFSGILSNETSDFEKTRLIASADNISELSGGTVSLMLRGTLASDNVNLSPVIDLQALSVVGINNKVNIPSHSNTNISVIDDKAIGTFNCSFAGNKLVNVSGTYFPNMKNIKIGRYITISGTASNNGLYLVKNIKELSTTVVEIEVDKTFVTISNTSTVITLHTRYVDEIATDVGSAAAKYITRKTQLALPATSIKVMIGSYRPADSELEIYYKILAVDDNSRFEDLPYIKATLDTAISPSSHYSDIKDYEYTINNLPEFSVMSCKVVMKSKNSANVIRNKDIRVIALA